MNTTTKIINFLQNYNAWRRGDETLGMPHPAEIGTNIQDAIMLLRKNAELETELAAAKAECNRLYESSPTALDALTAELARLRAEVERLKDGGVQRIKDTLATTLDERDAANARAKKAEAALATEREKVSVLREALISLMAEQGSNAERPICRDWWQAAMDKCRSALTATEGAK